MTNIGLHLENRQTQKLSPRLQHAVRLLQMSSLDFSAMVHAKLGENPFLEPEEEQEPTASSEDHESRDSGVEAYDDRDIWQTDGARSLRLADDDEISAMDMAVAETTLAAHLHGQINVTNLGSRDLLLAHMIIESLDDDGYLRTPLEELAELAELNPAVTDDEMRIALCRVQALDPLGVGARDIGECLRLQLASITCPRMRELAQTIVCDNLDTLAARDVKKLSARLNESPSMIEQVCDRLRRMNPRPGWGFGSSRIAYAVPDVVTKRINGHWTVRLNPAVVPRVRMNHQYADLFQRHRAEHHTEMAGHLQDARWTVHNVEQRFSTILDVATAIVRHQRHFLEFGVMAMKPLGLREIAEEVGVHESTVSRVTNNKYISTPLGVFELKHFFSRAMISSNGSACSGTAIRGLVKDIIEGEKPAQPLSDGEITRQLNDQGLNVARRTVTKYRQLLQIEPAERRRKHA